LIVFVYSRDSVVLSLSVMNTQNYLNHSFCGQCHVTSLSHMWPVINVILQTGLSALIHGVRAVGATAAAICRIGQAIIHGIAVAGRVGWVVIGAIVVAIVVVALL
jgi:hypothetical protein